MCGSSLYLYPAPPMADQQHQCPPWRDSRYRLACRNLRASNEFYSATSAFNFLPGRFAHFIDSDHDGMGNFPIPQELDPISHTLHQSRIFEGRNVQIRVWVKLFQVPDINQCIVLFENIGKAPLGKPPLKGHLPTLESRRYASAGTRLLSFMPSA